MLGINISIIIISIITVIILVLITSKSKTIFSYDRNKDFLIDFNINFMYNNYDIISFNSNFIKLLDQLPRKNNFINPIFMNSSFLYKLPTELLLYLSKFNDVYAIIDIVLPKKTKITTDTFKILKLNSNSYYINNTMKLLYPIFTKNKRWSVNVISSNDKCSITNKMVKEKNYDPSVLSIIFDHSYNWEISNNTNNLCRFLLLDIYRPSFIKNGAYMA